MQTELTKMTVNELVELRKHDMVKVNHEYQRGEVWKPEQKRKLIDSVMRGYQLPVIYLHDVEKNIAGRLQQSYEIIDGQQRIDALYRYCEGEFPLYNVNDLHAKFPGFLQSKPCPWGGKYFMELSEELQSHLLNAQLPVASITAADDNEVRDLFVRLQSGFPLNAQEKRDSYPGAFTEFILRFGGKPEIPRYPGHQFFQTVLGMKPGADRGKTRQLAAQIAILFLKRQEGGPDTYVDINTDALDDFYYDNLDFDQESPSAKRLTEILSKLTDLLGKRRGPKLRGHDAIHLMLLLDSIWDDYTRSWESELSKAQDSFSEALANGTQKAKDGQPDDFWNRYGTWIRSNSDRGDSIRRRHQFYSARMAEFMGNLEPKDPRRAFNQLEREIIYYRERGQCQLCEAIVPWDEAEAHHIIPHGRGGETTLENGALVHAHCHPKGAAAEEAFARKLGFDIPSQET